MAPKKRLHELARELDVTTDRLMAVALRLGIRFTSNFNAVEPEQEEKLSVAIKGPIRTKLKPIVRIVKTAQQKAEEEAAAEAEAELELREGVADLAEETSPEQLQTDEKDEVLPAELEPKADELEPVKEVKKVKSRVKTAEVFLPEKRVVKRFVKLPVARKQEEQPDSTLKVKVEKLEDRQVITKRVQAPTSPGKSVGVPVRLKAVSERLSQRKRRRKKEKAAKKVAEAFVPGKKRAKPPSVPTVEHVMLTDGMTLKELADKLGIKAKDIIQKILVEKGVISNINQVLDYETAELIAEDYGVTSERMTFEEEVALVDELKIEGKAAPRAPVVTFMGHVDHGKTTLLDFIRKSRVVEKEHGGITQHIGAYKVESDGHQIVFIDTPGHKAFTRLRARGAKVTDIVILVVAADDGVMPQTIEAIQHARAADVSIIVAITKTDLKSANVEKVKQGLAEHDILVESWGGEVVSVEVSGKTGKGVEDLLEMIHLVSEMKDLKAYPEVKGLGTVLEARLDRARGPVATVLVQNGTVRVGDYFIAGITSGKIKAMINDLGERYKEVEPSTPVEILGFNNVPEAGDQLQIVDDEAKARQMVGFRQEQHRKSHISASSKLSLDELFSKIEKGDVKELPIIVKGDVRGSVEALSEALRNLSTDKVKSKIMVSSPGAINESDVLLAGTSSAIIIGFNVRAQKSAQKLAELEGVEIRIYNVIYEAIDDVRNAMKGLLDPIFREVILGKAEVRQVFRIPKVGVIAGSYVTEGTLKRNNRARVIRDDVVTHDGRIGSLRRFKDDVREVKSGYECGIGIDNFQDIREGDIIEFYTKEEVAAEM